MGQAGRERRIVPIGRGAGAGRAQEQREGRNLITDAQRAIFLETLAATSNVTTSAKAAKISSRHVYWMRQRDAQFREAWEEALEEGYAALEMEVLHRMRFGSKKTETVAGKPVKTVHSFNDVTAVRLLIAHRETVLRRRAEREARAQERKIDTDALIERFKADLERERERRKAMVGHDD